MKKTFIWLLCFLMICINCGIAPGQAATKIPTDIRMIASLSSDGMDYIEGGILTKTDDLLLYGWTSGETWDEYPEVKHYPSCRNALAVLLSNDGETHWIFTDGNANVERMDSIIGAVNLDDKIILCHKHMLDYTWETIYGITVLDSNGQKIHQFDFDTTVVVEDISSTTTAILVSGYSIKDDMWIPFIYSINASGKYIFKYYGEPLSWSKKTSINNSFDEVAADEEGNIVGLLEQGNNASKLVILNSFDGTERSRKIPSLENANIYISNKRCWIGGYIGEKYSILCIDIKNLQSTDKIVPLATGERIIEFFPYENGFACIARKSESEYVLYYCDSFQENIHVVRWGASSETVFLEDNLVSNNNQIVLYSCSRELFATEQINIFAVSISLSKGK